MPVKILGASPTLFQLILSGTLEGRDYLRATGEGRPGFFYSRNLPKSEFQRQIRTHLCLSPGFHSPLYPAISASFETDAAAAHPHSDEPGVSLPFHLCAKAEGWKRPRKVIEVTPFPQEGKSSIREKILSVGVLPRMEREGGAAASAPRHAFGIRQTLSCLE